MKKDPVFYKDYFGMFGTVAAQSLIVFSVNLADSVMLGRFSETAMSGVSLANQLQFLLQCLVNGVGGGLVALGSQYWGAKNVAALKKVFTAALYTAAAISAVMGLAAAVAPAGVLGLLSNKAEIVAEGAAYLRIMAHSYVIFAVSSTLVALMRSVEKVRVGFYASVLALGFNLFLNYALIFGHFGFPRLGAAGAAAATLVSRVVELIYVLIYVFKIDKRVCLRPAEALRPDKTYLLDYLKTGLPLVGSGGSWGVAMFLQTAIIGRLGAAAIGANAVSAPVFQVVSVLYSSSSSASSVLIAKTVGENDIPRVKAYAKRLQAIFLFTGAVSGMLLFFCRRWIVDIYNVSAETRALSLTFMCILAVTVVGSAYEAPCLVGIVSGGGDTAFVLKNDLLFMWGIVLPLSALSAFVFRWPIPVTFFLLKLDQLLKCAVAAVKVNRWRWIRKLTRETEISAKGEKMDVD